MSRTVTISAVLAAAMMFAIGVAVVATLESAQATFPGENGKIAYFSSGVRGQSEGGIFTIEASGENRSRVTDYSNLENDPSYSPNGNRIAYSRTYYADPDDEYDGDAEIFTIRADGGDIRQVTNNYELDIQPSYSPSGNRIALVSWEGPHDSSGDREIFTVSADGGDRRQVTHNTKTDEWPDYAPTGNRIAFTRSDGHDTEIFTISADGENTRQITNNSRPDYQPSYSPNGNRIAFATFDGHDGEIYTIRIDGGGRRQITNNATPDKQPSYSPNGDRIAFTRDDGNDLEIYTIEATGGGQHRVTDNYKKEDLLPSWGIR